MKKILLACCVLITGGAFLYQMNADNTNNRVVPEKQTVTSESVVTMVAFGDSLTAGYGVMLDESYPSILESYLNTNNTSDVDFRVINMGVSGETTSGGVERVDFVLEQNPDIILLGLGANDMLRGTNTALIRTNLSTIIERIQTKNIPIILLGMRSQDSNGELYQKSFDTIYSDLSKKYQLTLVPFFLEGVAMVTELNTPDGIHPNKAGYEKIVTENIGPVVTKYMKDAFIFGSNAGEG